MKTTLKNKKPIQNKNIKTIDHKNLEAKINQFEIKDRYIIIFFAIITFLFFREILMQQKFMWEDFMSQYYPWRSFAAVTLSQGILPHWNPYTFGGMPFLADIQTAVFYPLHLLLTIFVTDDKLPFVALEYLNIFHYFMAGVFSYYLARSFDLNKWASILSGITFMFCGFMVTHAIHATYINPFTYMPLIFMFYNKSLSTCKLKYILLTGLFMGIVILCGHPQVILYMFFVFLLFGLYQIFLKFKENNYKVDIPLLRFIVIASVPFIIGIMLGAIQLLPTMRLSELSIRSEISYEQSLEGSLNYHNLFTLFSPNFFGQYNATKVAEYWGHEEGYQYLYRETCIYVGLSTLIFGMFGIIALWKKRIIKFLATISLFSILFALGDNFILYKFFYNFVPGFDKFRIVSRFAALVLPFSFSLLAAYGFNYFIKNVESKKVKKFIKYFMILISGFILLWLSYQFGIFENITDFYQDESFYNNSTLQLLKTVVILLILLGLVILYKKKIIVQQVILFLFILLLFTDFYMFGSQHNNGPNSPENYYINQELAKELRQEYQIELSRIQTRVKEFMHLFERNEGMLDFIFMLDGYNQLNLKDKFPPFRTDELMNVKYIATFDTVIERLYIEYNENYLPRAWMSYYTIVESSIENVAKILEDPTFEINTKVIIDQEPEIYINKTLIEEYVANYKIMFESYDINEIVLGVETSENGILVLSEIYYPNWKVLVDGIEKPMLRCHYSLRGVALEKGNHTVVFKYVDKDFQLGAIISLFALAIIIVLSFSVARPPDKRIGALINSTSTKSPTSEG